MPETMITYTRCNKKGPIFQYNKHSNYTLFLVIMLSFVIKATSSEILGPSQVPTITPSMAGEPTRLPVPLSNHPTFIQTQAPTVASTQLHPISNIPTSHTEGPTSHRPTISVKPSSFPTINRTTHPTTIHIHHYSIKPTAFRNPTTKPTPIPSRKPNHPLLTLPTSFPSTRKPQIKQPSLSPTFNLSDIPSTRKPSEFPSTQPTAKPTAYPSSKSSHPHLSHPTMKPTRYPSRIPSDYPSTLTTKPTSTPPRSTPFPSTNPSSHPSSYHQTPLSTHQPIPIPTSICHDSQSYHNPLTGDNCEHHKSTNCFMWKHMGLTDLQLDQLLHSCPISCHVLCNSTWWSSFVPVDLYFVNTSGLMSSMDRETFTTLALNFIDRDLNHSVWKNSLHVTLVLVTNQTLLRNNTTTNTRSLWNTVESRKLMGQFTLHVSLYISFYSMTPKVDEARLKNQIVSTLTGKSFLNQLEEQREYFVGVYIANSTKSPLPTTTRASINHSNIIWMSIVLPLLALLVLGSAYYAALRRSKSKPHLHPDSFRQTYPPKFIESNIDDQEHPHYMSTLAHDFATGLSIFTTKSGSDHSTKGSPSIHSIHESPQSLQEPPVVQIPLQESTINGNELAPPIIVIDISDDDEQSNLGSEISSKDEAWLYPPNISRMPLSPSNLDAIQNHFDRDPRPSMYDYLFTNKMDENLSDDEMLNIPSSTRKQSSHESFSMRGDPDIVLMDRRPVRTVETTLRPSSSIFSMFSKRAKTKQHKNRSELCFQQDSDVESNAPSLIILR